MPHFSPSLSRSHLAVILTNRCNLRCSYCLRAKCNQDINLKQLKQTLEQARQLGYRHLGLTGGEILLYPHLKSLLQFLGQQGWHILFETNGLLFNEHWVGILHQFIQPGRLSFSVSLDSHLAAEHDQQRGRGSFQKARRAIKLIHRRFPQSDLRLIAVVAGQNLNQPGKIKKFIALAENLGARRLNFQKAVIAGDNQQAQVPESRFRLIQSVIRGYQGSLAIKVHRTQSQLNPRCRRLEQGNLCLSPRGIHPCIFNDEVVLGQLKDFIQVFHQRLPSFTAFRTYALSTAGTVPDRDCDRCRNQVIKQISLLNHAGK